VPQIFKEAEAVSVAAEQAAVRLYHHQVDRPHAPRRVVQPVDQGGHRLLVRHRHVAAGEAEGGKASQGGREPVWMHRHRHIGAGNAVLAQPVAMQHRRARLGDRPADHTRQRHAR
jgi:hypothetical protein